MRPAAAFADAAATRQATLPFDAYALCRRHAARRLLLRLRALRFTILSPPAQAAIAAALPYHDIIAAAADMLPPRTMFIFFFRHF